MSNGLLWSAMRKSLMRVLVVGGQIIKWGVIGHVTLEYVAAVVIVSSNIYLLNMGLGQEGSLGL